MNTESTTNNHLSIINNHLACAIGTTKGFVRKNSPFLTNKANFRKVKLYVNTGMSRDYEQMDTCSHRKNKANSNPNKANLLNAKMNVYFYSTKDYEDKSNCALFENKPNTKPIQTQTNPISEYPCVFELAVYNLVLRDGNVMHSMPDGRNFDGEYMKWQMRQKQMR